MHDPLTQGRTGICALVPHLSARHSHKAGSCNAQVTSAGQDWNLCPRTALKRQLERLETSQSMTLKVGFELEFYLLRPRRDENGVTQQEPLGHSHLYSQSSALLGAVTGEIPSLRKSGDLGMLESLDTACFTRLSGVSHATVDVSCAGQARGAAEAAVRMRAGLLLHSRHLAGLSQHRMTAS